MEQGHFILNTYDILDNSLNSQSPKQKKAILYNTHMFTLINNPIQYLKKLRHVLETFKNRDDVVLWWRPHPNTEVNVKQYRPEILNEYLQIVDNYKREGWGIYDDTPDLHRAIAWTDAYYGDYSSVVALYQATGKPVMLQDVNIINDVSNIKLQFSDVSKDSDGKYWAYEIYHDGLFELDFDENKAQLRAQSGYIQRIKDSKQLFYTRYIGIYCIGDEVVCFPNATNPILIYNRKTKSTKEVEIDSNYILSPNEIGFMIRHIVMFDNYLYCFSFMTKAIVVYDINNYSITYHTQLFSHIGHTCSNYGNTFVKYPIYKSRISSEGKLRLIMRECSDLIEYSLPTQNIKIIASNPLLSESILADYDGQNYWLITEKTGMLIKWNPDTNLTTQYNIAKAGYDMPKDICSLSRLVDCGEHLLIIPAFWNEVIKFTKSTETFSKYTALPVPTDNNTKLLKYSTNFSCIKDRLFAFSKIDGIIYELDKITDDIISHKIDMNDADCEKLFTNYCNILKSTPDIHIYDVGNIAKIIDEVVKIDGMSCSTRTSDLAINLDGTTGKCINTYIRQ